MANIGDGFKDIFLAGVGAMAITGEKAKEVVDTLIAKGEITVEQGKQINTELGHKVSEAAESARYTAIEARMSIMTPEEREAFAAKVAELAKQANAADAAQVVAEPAAADAAPAVPAADDAPAAADGDAAGAPTA